MLPEIETMPTPIRKHYPDEETIPLWAQDIKDDVKDLIAAVRGKNSDPGLVGRVDSLEKFYRTATTIIIGLTIAIWAAVVLLILQTVYGAK